MRPNGCPVGILPPNSRLNRLAGTDCQDNFSQPDRGGDTYAVTQISIQATIIIDLSLSPA